MKRKTSAEWADLIAAMAVIGLGLGFYAFTSATHLQSSPKLPVAAAGFKIGR
jgi:hypothetical protein